VCYTFAKGVLMCM